MELNTHNAEFLLSGRINPTIRRMNCQKSLLQGVQMLVNLALSTPC